MVSSPRVTLDTVAHETSLLPAGHAHDLTVLQRQIKIAPRRRHAVEAGWRGQLVLGEPRAVGRGRRVQDSALLSLPGVEGVLGVLQSEGALVPGALGLESVGRAGDEYRIPGDDQGCGQERDLGGPAVLDRRDLLPGLCPSLLF